MSTVATPAAAPAAPATPPAEKKTVPKDLLKRMAKGDPAKPIEPPPAPVVTPPAPDPSAAAAAPAAPIETTTPAPRVKKKGAELPAIPAAPSAPSAEIARIVKDAIAEQQPAAPVAPVAPVLDAEQQRDLELAKFAAENHPEYKDLPAQILAFNTEREQLLARKSAELGGRNSPEFRDYLQGDEFKEFCRTSAPSYRRGDRQKIYEEYIEDRGARRALRQLQPEIEALKQRQNEQQALPQINSTVSDGLKIMLTDDAPQKDEALVEFAANAPKFVQENPIEAEIIIRGAQFTKNVMEETMRITSGVVNLANVTNPTPEQQWIDQFVESTERELETKFPNGAQVGDKIIVTAGQMQRLQAARVNLQPYRRLTGPEIVGAIAVARRTALKNELQAQRQRLEQAGYKRVKVTPATPAVVNPVLPRPPASPIASSSPAGGGPVTPPQKKEHWSKKYAQSPAVK